MEEGVLEGRHSQVEEGVLEGRHSQVEDKGSVVVEKADEVD